MGEGEKREDLAALLNVLGAMRTEKVQKEEAKAEEGEEVMTIEENLAPLAADRQTVLKTMVFRRDALLPFLRREASAKAKEIAEQISALFRSLMEGWGEQRFFTMKNKPVWFDPAVAGLYPCLESASLPVFETLELPAETYPGLDFAGFHFETMTREECQKTFRRGNGNPYIKGDGTVKHFRAESQSDCILTRGRYQGQSRVVYTNGTYSWWRDSDEVTLVPIHRLRGVNAPAMSLAETVLQLLALGLVPQGLSRAQEKTYRDLSAAYPHMVRYCHAKGETLVFEEEKFQRDIKRGNLSEVLFGYDFDRERLAEEIAAGKGQRHWLPPIEMIKEDLLQCDYRRANLAPYEEKFLTDIHMGHWELFEEAEEGDILLPLPQNTPFVARPPHMDVSDGVCAIDFGTKSTVVACRDRGERLLRVGQANYEKAPELEDYENPTALALRDIRGFERAYRARSGRPFTEWEQVTASHQAQDTIRQATDSRIYYSVFSELKQWANDRAGRLLLRDLHGAFLELKPYAELTAEDLDPIEMYAYYLGLYINNMHRGIYLTYVLSFPVTYKLAVRERILQSFARGLKKSLPPALLRNEAAMKRFSVYAGASEPAAYAISALQEFGLEPEDENDEVFYAVFDFGGGTTDYDFGVERIPKDDKSNFVIERAGGGGNEYLGGENIIDLLAYEVYKDNIAEMREKGIPFVRPELGKPFAGSETLVRERKEASQEAQMNLKRLAERLRPIWEQPPEYRHAFEDRGKIPLDFFLDGKRDEAATVNVDVAVNIDRLQACVEEVIENGVKNFFDSFLLAFHRAGWQPTTVHLFLAGNSCKSVTVQKIFYDYMGKYEKEIAKEIVKEKNQVKDVSDFFRLYPPLGTSMAAWDGAREPEATLKAEEALKAEEGQEDLEIDKIRTGKTGVVFGLLRSRRGGRDVVIRDLDQGAGEEIPFPYYLGDMDRKNRFRVRIGKETGYHVWKKFTFADEAEFELYYTKEARSMDNEMAAEDVGMVRCAIDEAETGDDRAIYLRKAAPEVVEYVVAAEDAPPGASPAGKIYRKELC